TRPGTPFIVYTENGTEKYISNGYQGAVKYFSSVLGIENPIPTNEEKKNQELILTLLGLLIIIGPLAYLGLKK
ncbi:MAG: hypothetical protein GY828_08115, partial [Candidatus Gracilibacteria bacterium]|nr:hypothetical protein [Candidatus Gracilibacteria bacterium]